LVTRRPADEDEGGFVVLLLLLGLLVLAGAGYLTAGVVAGDKVPRGTSVAGIEIGGLSPEDASRLLQERLSPRLRAPFTVSIGGVTQQITPEQAGIAVDYSGTVARTGSGRTLDPGRLWDYFDGGEDVDPVLRVDGTRMTGLLEDLSEATGTRARDGAISFASGHAEIVEPRLGAVVDTSRADDLIVEAWARGEEQVVLPLSVSEPRIDSADLRAAIKDFANPALSGPVTLEFARSRATLSPHDYAPLLRTRVQDGRLVPDVRSAELAGLVGLTSRDAAPADATVAMSGGSPQVVPARPGATYGPDDVSRAFLDAVVQAGDARTVEVDGTRVPADFSTREARKLGVTELVSSSTVPASGTDPDLHTAVRQLSGTLLLPGETFSLNSTAGQAGASGTQLATATYVAAYSAGLEVVDRTAPTQRVHGAPLGREATAAYGGVDLQWRNDTAYGVLVQAAVDPAGSVTVELWSTTAREVTTSISARSNTTVPTTVTLATPDCVPASGSDGFEVDVTRVVRDVDTDAVVHTDTAHTAYLPSDEVVCLPPAPAPPPAPTTIGGVRD
jgi:vancomycin resistance protein YoaR